MKEKKVLGLEEGIFEIETSGNLYTSISSDPFPTPCAEYATKSRKTPAIDPKMELQPNTHQKTKPAKHQNSGSCGHSFSEVSKRARKNIMNGNFDSYSQNLFEMASILEREGMSIDELKVRMMKFHIDLSGLEKPPFIDWENIDLAGRAARFSRLTDQGVDELFIDTVKANMTPRHDFTVADSNRMFLLALSGNNKKTFEIIEVLTK